VENQHQQIKGYRDLNQMEIDAMNAVKSVGETVGNLITELEGKNVDGRWLAIGKTELQKGFMALTRSIAKPTSF
jgi:hypothetical protein